MSNPTDLKTIGKLAEEAGELCQAVARCMIQGIDAVEPGSNKPNREWLEEEIADVLLNIQIVSSHFALRLLQERMDRKRPLLLAWHKEA